MASMTLRASFAKAIAFARTASDTEALAVAVAAMAMMRAHVLATSPPRKASKVKKRIVSVKIALKEGGDKKNNRRVRNANCSIKNKRA